MLQKQFFPKNKSWYVDGLNLVADGQGAMYPYWAELTILVGSVFFGIGSGVYQPAELTLALRCIAKKEETAQSLGLWSIGYFLGACLAPAISGAVIQFFFWFPPTKSRPSVGYAFLLTVGIVMAYLTWHTVRMVSRFVFRSQTEKLNLTEFC